MEGGGRRYTFPSQGQRHTGTGSWRDPTRAPLHAEQQQPSHVSLSIFFYAVHDAHLCHSAFPKTPDPEQETYSLLSLI
jgi:hypothetical protein